MSQGFFKFEFMFINVFAIKNFRSIISAVTISSSYAIIRSFSHDQIIGMLFQHCIAHIILSA
jgi:hypothetical protein